MQKIVSILKEANIEDKEIRKNHVKSIHRTVVERQIKLKNLICPMCNGNLKLRNGRIGTYIT